MRVGIIMPIVLALVSVAIAQGSSPGRRPRPTTRPAASAPNIEEAKKDIAELQRRDIEASIALDVDKLLELRTDDVVYLPPGHAPVLGKPALRQYLAEVQEQFANTDIVGYDQTWQEVQVVGDLACQWGSTETRLKPAVGSETVHMSNTIRILKRQPDGIWKISRVIWNDAAPKPAGGTDVR
jgi:ketosteroid isomerase-like protein